MNRAQKRAMQKAGQLGEDGAPAPARRERKAPPPRPKEERTKPRQFLREVRAELRKVAWPTRSETVNYAIITIITIVFFTVLIFLLDLAFAEFMSFVFDTGGTSESGMAAPGPGLT